MHTVIIVQFRVVFPWKHNVHSCNQKESWGLLHLIVKIEVGELFLVVHAGPLDLKDEFRAMVVKE